MVKNIKIDREYSAFWFKEVEYLTQNKIPYEFVKEDSETHVTVWKYKKTPQLFEALKQFYENVYYK